MVAVYEKNWNTQGFQTPEPVAQGELGGDARSNTGLVIS